MTQAAFQYRAIDPRRRGAAARGVLRAADQHEAYRQIVASGLKPVKITPVAGSHMSSASRCAAG